jgi:hypothetical protein
VPKPSLTPDLAHLETEVIETLVAGLKQWRSDLRYPASWSDWQACVRGLLVMFDVKRKPLPKPLSSPCPDCEGLGHFVDVDDSTKYLTSCKRCSRTGKVYY